LFTKADRVIVLSETWKNKIENSMGTKVQLEVVYNPCIELQHPVDTTTRIPYILFAGTLNERKGFQDLIQAFAGIAKSNPSWGLIFAGNGDIESGKDLAKNLDIESQVIFKGWISGAEKNETFLKASIFCLPSYAEGFPMSVLDAMAYSIPVITTPVGGILDIFSDNHDLLIFQPGDIKALGNKIQLLIDNEELRKKLAQNASMLINRYFRVDQSVKKIDSIYKSLVGERP